MSKKSWPILYSNLLYETGQVFLDILNEIVSMQIDTSRISDRLWIEIATAAAQYVYLYCVKRVLASTHHANAFIEILTFSVLET